MDLILQERTERYRQRSAEKVKATELERREYELNQKLKEIEEKERQAAEVLAWKEEAKRDPVTAWRKAGVDPTQMIKMIASEATPEAEANYNFQQLQQRLEAQERQFKEYLELQKQEQQQKAMMEANRQASAGFDHFYKSDDCKSAKMIWSRGEFEQACRSYADNYIKETGQPICPWNVLIPKVEAMAKSKLEAILKTVNPEKSVPVEEPATSKKAVKTIGAQSNQRFATPKDISKMTDQEQREYLIAVAKSAKK